MLSYATDTFLQKVFPKYISKSVNPFRFSTYNIVFTPKSFLKYSTKVSFSYWLLSEDIPLYTIENCSSSKAFFILKPTVSFNFPAAAKIT